MLSFEPFTLRDLGSSQVFQTGETFGGAPLIDYQHPARPDHGVVGRVRAADCARDGAAARRAGRRAGAWADCLHASGVGQPPPDGSALASPAGLDAHHARRRHRGRARRTLAARNVGVSRARAGRGSDGSRSRCARFVFGARQLDSWRHARTSVGGLARGAARHRARRRHAHHGIGRTRGQIARPRGSADVGLGSEPALRPATRTACLPKATWHCGVAAPATCAARSPTSTSSAPAARTRRASQHPHIISRVGALTLGYTPRTVARCERTRSRSAPTSPATASRPSSSTRTGSRSLSMSTGVDRAGRR